MDTVTKPAITNSKPEPTPTAITKPYTIPAAAKMLGVSYQHMWRLIRSNDIPHVRLGTKILIPSHVIEAIAQGTFASDSHE